MDAKRARSYEGGTYNGRCEIQDKPKFKKRFSNQVPYKFTKARNYRVAKRRSQKERGGDSPSGKHICTKCGKKHVGECLVGTDNCSACRKSGNKVRDCPMVTGQMKGNSQAQESGPYSAAPKKNCFYALHSRSDQEDSRDVVTGMSQVFSINV
ncbi:uncharacterized protein LOC107013173 [Solanum pennellii]|uniref:Uncharacterized protein LOC107013173 n=1 Tax=Solanum pennellii TaxID=28526 RepID=A0ABM1GBF6_SOLPN|nr:uncharacterized protein LOC107013173 [Solanum pennellii]